MAKQTIGNLLVSVGVDLTEFEKKMNQFQKEFGKVGQQAQDAGTQIALAFGAVSGAITTGLGVAVKKAADFEQGLSNIKAVSGATTKEMEQIKEMALQLGADTGYGATEAARGMEELIKAGVSLEDIMNGGIKGALTLASAGELELAEAAEIASTALNAFKDDGLNVSKAADILAGGANASATSVQELKFGLSQVAVVASGAGMSFEDTTTALAVFAQNGLKGSDAGTSLKTALSRLTPTTKETKDLFKELGLTAADGSNQFYDAQGSLKSLDQISQLLKDSMAGLTDEQRSQAMMTLFGSDAVRAGNILFKEGADGVKKMKEEMGKVTAEQVAAEKLNNFNGALKKLKGSFDTFMISIGDVFLPALKSIAAGLASVSNWFNSLSPATKTVIAVVLASIAAFTGLIAIIGVVIGVTGALVAVEWAVVAPILAVIGVVVAIIAAFALLTAGIVILYKKNEEFRNFINMVWAGIKTTISTVVNALVPIVKMIWQSLLDNLKAAWAIVKPLVTEVFAFIKGIFTGISDFIKNNMGIIKTTITVVWTVVKSLIVVALGAISAVFRGVLPVIVAYFRVQFNIFKLVVTTVFNVIKTAVKIAFNLIKGIFKTGLALLKGDWKGAWESIKTTVKNILGNIGDFFKNMTKTFFDAGKGLINAIKDGIVDSAKGVYDSVKGVAKKIRDFLPFSPAKVGPLSDLDKLDFGGPIADSIKAGSPDVQAKLNSMLTVPDVNPSVLTDMGGGTTVIMQLDSKTIARKTFEHMGGTFRLRGAVT